MKQHTAVIETMEKLGGIATLGQLYQEVLKNDQCSWSTQTPHASIRRIVQTRPEIYKIKPGLYGLGSYQKRLEDQGIIAETPKNKDSEELRVFNHTYYQGILLLHGNLLGMSTFAPNQDKNQKFLNQKLCDVRTLQSLPQYSYPHLVNTSSTIDTIWFNERQMPHSFFEVESSTFFQNSFNKLADLRDFHVDMVIVADENRRKEYETKLSRSVYNVIRKRIRFQNYEITVKRYEVAAEQARLDALL